MASPIRRAVCWNSARLAKALALSIDCTTVQSVPGTGAVATRSVDGPNPSPGRPPSGVAVQRSSIAAGEHGAAGRQLDDQTARLAREVGRPMLEEGGQAGGGVDGGARAPTGAASASSARSSGGAIGRTRSSEDCRPAGANWR
ncbi:MAG: hypothetical protein R3C69_09770 [Geminicoccaceae bacterium]